MDSLLSALWREVAADKLLRVFSIQDGAADPRIYRNFILAAAENACLYEGRIPAVLLEAAPHLVRLTEIAPYTRWYLGESWGNHWGIFFQSKAKLPDLRRHFRGLLSVRAEDGRMLSFRFFDPRVLRVYLPTCTSAELTAFFGPVKRFFAQGEKFGELLRFEVDEGRLVQTRIDVTGRADAPVAETALGTIAGIPGTGTVASQHRAPQSLGNAEDHSGQLRT